MSMRIEKYKEGIHGLSIFLRPYQDSLVKKQKVIVVDFYRFLS